jgi:hypothetical protein
MRTRGPQMQGARAVYLLRPERQPPELVRVAVFDDEAAYNADAGAPEQDAWYRRLREALEADPEWEDGAYLVATQIPESLGG